MIIDIRFNGTIQTKVLKEIIKLNKCFIYVFNYVVL